MKIKENEPLISIIVPVYNAENFLIKCLDSLANQSYQNLEVIMINDGSTDNSGSICEEYCKKDNRFRVFHKENGGVSSARNRGLKEVSGEYVGFVDPDDWIEPNMFELLQKLAVENNSDISACGYFRETSDGVLKNKLSEHKTTVYTQTEALNAILDESAFKGFTCNKLFSTKTLKNVKFDEEVHFCEDLLFCCEAILNATNFVYDTTPCYHYIMHNTNASQSQFSTKKLTSVQALEKIVSLLKNKKGVKLNKFKNYFMHMNISLLMNGIQENKCTKENRKVLKRNLFKYKMSELTGKSVKLSCALSRINVNLSYFVWKTVK